MSHRRRLLASVVGDVVRRGDEEPAAVAVECQSPQALAVVGDPDCLNQLVEMRRIGIDVDDVDKTVICAIRCVVVLIGDIRILVILIDDDLKRRSSARKLDVSGAATDLIW